MIHDYVLIPLKSQITTNFCWDTVTCLRADTEFCDAGFSLVNTFTLNSAVAKKWWSHRANRGLRWEKTPGNKKQERVCITLHWKTVCCQCGFLDLGPVGGFLSFSVVPKKKKKKDEIDTSKINILPGLTPWTPQRLVQMNQTEAECSHYLTLSDMSSQICDQTSWRWHSVHLLWTFFFSKQKRGQLDNAMLPPNAEYSILQAPEVEELQLWFDCNSSLLMSKDNDKFREILRLRKMYLSHLPFWKISFFDDYAVKQQPTHLVPSSVNML